MVTHNLIFPPGLKHRPHLEPPMTTLAEPPTAAEHNGRPDRTPPHDLGAEQVVLGAMMLSKDAIGDIVEIVKAVDFYRGAHATIYDRIVDLFGKGEPADPFAVAASMPAQDLVRVGGAPYLHTLIAAVPTVANGAYYARIVADKALLRRLAEAHIAGLKAVYAQDDRPAADVVDASQQALYDLTSARAAGEWSRLAEVFPRTLDDIEAAGKGEGPLGIPTGFTDLDRLLQGLLPGQLVVIAGRPGQGKSTLATGIALNAAIKNGLASAIFSLEMSTPQIVLRVLAAEARVPLNVLKSGHLTDDDWTRLARRMGEIEEAPLFVDDTPSMNMMEIRAKARRLKQRHDLKLIVVDYLQLMTSPKRTESRQQEVAEISRGLKLLGKEVECPVIAVSQLNRGPEQRADKRPMLSDLRESGSIEADADVVILTHRDDYYDKESPRAGEADFIVAKHRDGPTDTVTVAAQLHLARFVDMAIA